MGLNQNSKRSFLLGKYILILKEKLSTQYLDVSGKFQYIILCIDNENFSM